MLERFPFLRQPLNKVQLTLFITLVFTTLAAGVFRTQSIVFMAALLMGAPLLSIIIGRLGSRRLAVTRTLPESGSVGDTIEGAFTVYNRSRWPALLAQVYCGEAKKTGVRVAGSILSTQVDEDYVDDADDHPVSAVGGKEQIIPLLAGNGQFSWRQSWCLRRRGVFQIAPARAGVLDPLGLYALLAPKTAPHEIVVLPRPIRINRLGLLDGSRMGDGTPHHATVVVDAMDFHGVRPWTPGEAIRRVHWKSTARTRQLHVIEWEENIASDLAILLDTQAAVMAGDDTDNTLETSITLTASIAAYLLENGYRVQFFCWQQTAASPQEDNQQEDDATEAAGANPQNTKLRLVQHESSNANGIGPTLNLLARLGPTQDARASLAFLVQAALPRLPLGRRMILLTSSLADIAAAQGTAGGSGNNFGGGLGGSPGRALVMDAASFDATTAGPDSAAGPDLSHHPSLRVVRRGDSLGAALEQS